MLGDFGVWQLAIINWPVLCVRVGGFGLSPELRRCGARTSGS